MTDRETTQATKPGDYPAWPVLGLPLLFGALAWPIVRHPAALIIPCVGVTAAYALTAMHQRLPAHTASTESIGLNSKQTVFWLLTLTAVVAGATWVYFVVEMSVLDTRMSVTAAILLGWLPAIPYAGLPLMVSIGALRVKARIPRLLLLHRSRSGLVASIFVWVVVCAIAGSYSLLAFGDRDEPIPLVITGALLTAPFGALIGASVGGWEQFYPEDGHSDDGRTD